MSPDQLAQYFSNFLIALIAGLVCYWLGFRRGKRAGILRGGILALEAIDEWKRQHHYR